MGVHSKIYNKLDSLENKIDEEKSKSNSKFAVTLLMSSGLALFIVGLTFTIQLLNNVGGNLWVICIGYIGFGLFLLKIGINTNSRINEGNK